MTSRIVLTYEDYAALPGDGKRYELHEGELRAGRASALPRSRAGSGSHLAVKRPP
jgi:hypothetical protein